LQLQLSACLLELLLALPVQPYAQMAFSSYWLPEMV